MPPSDFDLYPSQDYSDLLSQAHYPPNNPHQFTFGQPHQPHHSFSAPFKPTNTNVFAMNPFNRQGGFLPYSPVASPASAAQSFDVCPPHLSSASESGASVHSTSSSAQASPSMNQQFAEPWSVLGQGLGLGPGLEMPEFASCGFEYDTMVATDKISGCVDPNLINPFQSSAQFTTSPYPDFATPSLPYQGFVEQPPSPAPSNQSVHSHSVSDSRRFKTSGSQSPYLHNNAFQPYPAYNPARRPSVASIQSRQSQGSRRSGSYELDEEAREKGLCPIEGCGRVFKDLKAHMLTHQNERPEKCPITSCEYHLKGFARKYDKNRHTLTHYKGTMVCGFCPGSGSAAEKSFNRADVFKRHLTAVHGVEQTPPNSRKKSPSSSAKRTHPGNSSAAGTCSTCSVTFANAQEFYEHLDDCVLRVVQQADPAEAINHKLLSSVVDDKNVKETLDRHCLSRDAPSTTSSFDEDDDEDDFDVDDANDATYGVRRSEKGNANARSGRIGLTLSKGGVTLPTATSRKKRKHYPTSWGCPAERMRMKKRVLCVYDGQRRLWKDDMMLNQDLEVRITLPGTGPDGRKMWVTDLDVQTLKRAEALHAMPEADKGENRWDNVVGGDLDLVDAATPTPATAALSLPMHSASSSSSSATFEL
ncbi:hypothetical protein BC567DRAFT_244673 [Phyllosticta citribraziliensis]